jgi:hypothetical protein
MKKSDMMAAIESKRQTTEYSIWRIGLTNDLIERKVYWRDTEKESVDHWKDWQADSLSDAQDIESHFINKGMKGGVGGDLSDRKTVYVYMF